MSHSMHSNHDGQEMLFLVSTTTAAATTTSGQREQLELDEGHESGLLKLLLLSFVSVSGSLGSLFLLSALTVVPSLQRVGHAFLASASLGHLLVTSGVLPSVCIGIMSGVRGLCRLQWPLIQTSLLVHLHSFMFLAMDSLIPSLFSRLRVSLVCLCIWIMDAAVVLVLVSLGQEEGEESPLNICSPLKGRGNHHRLWITLLSFFVLVPVSVTLVSFLGSLLLASSSTRRSLAMTKTHATVYVVSLLLTSPLLLSLLMRVLSSPSSFPSPSPSLNYSLVWTCISASVSYSFLYGFLDRDFGDSFLQLFYYCCCKSHVNWNSSRKQPHLLSSSNGSGNNSNVVSSASMMTSSIPLMSMGGHHHHPSIPVMNATSTSGSGPFRALRTGFSASTCNHTSSSHHQRSHGPSSSGIMFPV